MQAGVQRKHISHSQTEDRAGVSTGLPASEMADRVVNAIRERRFYILSQDGWMDSARSRIQDILEGRNPTLAPPVMD